MEAIRVEKIHKSNMQIYKCFLRTLALCHKGLDIDRYLSTAITEKVKMLEAIVKKIVDCVMINCGVNSFCLSIALIRYIAFGIP